MAKCLRERMNYAMNPDKTDGGRLVSAYECNPQIADAEFLYSKRLYAVRTGRTQKNDVIAYQVRQSFKPGEITPEEANRVGYEFAQRFLKGKHAFIVATHTDRAHVHNHIIWNSVTLDCGRKFEDFYCSAAAVARLSNTICIEHGLSVIDAPKKGGDTSYGTWLREKKEPAERERIRAAIDAALEEKPKSFEDLLRLLGEAGYVAALRGNDISIRSRNDRSWILLSSLKEPYTKETLSAVIEGKREHIPGSRTAAGEDGGPGLLVEIDRKLREGQGPGGGKQVKNPDLKQMAKTISYLTENRVFSYGALKKAAEDAVTKYNVLAVEIKAAEQRMAEISALRTHVLNYMKTRDVYAAFRRAGCSEKFREEHEADIVIHQAARKALEGLGIRKLPSAGSLDAEYSVLLGKKKKAYAEYREARARMRELLIHKANVDALLGKETGTVSRNRDDKAI